MSIIKIQAKPYKKHKLKEMRNEHLFPFVVVKGLNLVVRGWNLFLFSCLTTHPLDSLPSLLSHYPDSCLTTQTLVSLPSLLSHFPASCLTTQTLVSLPSLLSHFPASCLTTQTLVSLPTLLSHYPASCLTSQPLVSLPRLLSHYPASCLTCMRLRQWDLVVNYQRRDQIRSMHLLSVRPPMVKWNTKLKKGVEQMMS